MKLRSTGLGETVLEAKIGSITKKDDYLILHVNTTEPVQWHVRAALEYSDILTMIKWIFKGPVFKFLFLGIKNWRHPRDTDDF